ncbi:glucose-1-phosphate adenylyltransferase [Macrococcoides bohemicum]|uniref:Glucose-1-phosphate adenylyltransferase n=1 Tax=Macrococcoides bohemicum TaxID=1903056 RepID=A0AAJ4PCQ8_9STAP|nr:glucose-1-phosphate adenylyltransferase [Macrococcus bohemicus]MBC9874145.1 glucose-1-phosphate adenylyltransferase [Macrococcus bohemicus]QYA43340.1 glucose-1-phosphate adenylyltransferase [Macrococcus bohemicus]
MAKEIVGMLLAGGKGTRLGQLTKNVAKPAVPFGGKYRIIDFTLSNLTNSNINTVGVLVQYAPLMLNRHIGMGKPWSLDKLDGGVTVLAPFADQTGASWFEGTADAITKNIHFIDQYDPEYLLILSGDHIYQMDYQAMLDHHKEKNADATISVIEVPFEEASRFGILNTEEDLKIYEFDEKPAVPKNNLASMGIYIFNWKVLREYLVEDEKDTQSEHDFGNDIIPKMLADNKLLYAYRFDGYWKDVGTIQSYWEANMDLLNEDLSELLNSKTWPTFSHEANLPPQFIGSEANITDSLICPGSFIFGHVEHSVLFSEVTVGNGAFIKDSIIHPKTVIGENCKIHKAIIMDKINIPDGTVIDGNNSEEPIVVGPDNLSEFTGGSK